MANVKTFDLIIEFEDHALTFGNLSRVAVARYVSYYTDQPNFVRYSFEESK